MFYDVYSDLCKKKKMSESKVAEVIGLNRSAVVKWKKGATPGGPTIQKIANYFGVSTDYLLGTVKDKAPTQQDRRLGDEEIKAAFFGGYSDELTKDEVDELWDDARDYLRYKIEQKKKRRE